MRDNMLDGALKKVLKRRPVSEEASCPDDNLMAAYLEHRLSGAEADRLESHAADCSKCSEVLALSLQIEDLEGQQPVAADVAPSSRRILFRFSIPVSVVAMMVVAIAAGLLYFHAQRESRLAAPMAETASAKMPEKPRALPAQDAEARQEKALAPSTPAPSRKWTAPAAKRVRDEMSPPELAGAIKPDEESKPSVVPSVGIVGGVAAPPPVSERMLQANQISPPEGKSLGGAEAARYAAETAQQVRPAKVEAAADQVSLDAKEKDAPAVDRMRLMKSRGVSYAPSPAIHAGVLQSVLKGFYSLSPKGGEKLESDKIGERVFLRYEDYWIDAACRDHQDAPLVEVSKGSQEAADVLDRVTDVKRLLSSANAVFIFWQGKILTIK